MDDLELLSALPRRIDPPDAETKERMRMVVQAQIVSRSARRPRRRVRAGMLAVAAAVAAASLAAGIAVHPWTADDPVTVDGISDPTGQVSTRADLESVVAEFAPAIRLPDGGSFGVWIQRQTANPESSLGHGMNRTTVVQSMVFVSQCQWGQQWLDASARGDRAGVRQAERVVGGVYEWWRSHAAPNDIGTARMLDLMQRGDPTGVQLAESACGYTGSWGTTPAEQDAKAKGDLPPAAQVVQQYLRRGGDPAAFDPGKAARLDASINWTWSHMQPAPASPGTVFIAPSAAAHVTLVSVSEAGTQFCAVVTEAGLERGITMNDLSTVENADGTAVNAKDPGPVTCIPGGW